MTREQKQAALIRAGLALYGRRWQADIRDALELKDARLVRQWASGDRPVPEDAIRKLGALLLERRREINAALRTLKF